MATPDLSTLASSAQIFSSTYTLPQIRAIHKSLHVQIDEKASRLRTQVGSSYRDLLGTADTIVQMRGDNDAVQGVLGRMGGKCGRAVVGAKVAGLGNFVAGAKGGNLEAGGMEVVARARLLEACGLVVGRVLKGAGVGDEKLGRGDRLVLASKVLVLSRLLVKSFEAAAVDHDVESSVERTKKSLGSLRRRLLRSIEKVLEQSGEDVEQDDVLKALCAYSLATSSGARDVLRHFLRVRGDAMALAIKAEENERQKSSDDVLKSLNLYTKTLLDVQALVPFKLAAALAGLKKHALLADQTLKKLEGLRLDIYERWCGDEIQFFTPFIRHDDLEGLQARDMLISWAKKGGEVLIEGLKTTMARMTEFKMILDLRTNVLQLWIRDGGKAKGFDPSEMLDELRGAINSHMLQVLETKVNKLNIVRSEVSATLDAWQDGVTDRPVELWNDNSLDLNLSSGTDHFLQELLARLHGRNDSVSKAINCFHSWRHVIDDVGGVVEQLEKQRWDNDIDEIEDEETIDARQQLLSKDDPRMLREKLNSSLEKAFNDLNRNLAELWSDRQSASNSGKVAMYLIRILRDIRTGLPPKLTALSSFGLAMVPSLHNSLALSVLAEPLEAFTTSALTEKTVVGRPLWEGSPELPAHPSPRLFGFLRDVSAAMGDAGMDLWSPTAIVVLKGLLRTQLCEMWLEALALHLADVTAEEKSVEVTEVAAEENGEANGADGKEKEDENKEEEDEKESAIEEGGAGGEEREEKGLEEEEKSQPGELVFTAQQAQDLLTQWLFDISLLRCSLGPSSNSTQDEFEKLEEKVLEGSGLKSSESHQRITKSSQEYWKKTSLLFGLLA